ncbi:DUF1240 domain-containing protein [Serratia sp. JSRIV001]|uniref:DUF1240 domain-containing protein n=1 Tax=Serratia TaxID=613 RepID=UPI0005637A03|nr:MULTISPECIES: DUF1240 domain-containing protein [Serratia]ALX92837.1 hypothetical protein AV650_04365 [Serratia fonticola]MBC3251409.1 DUF1240 domain-containing protein [Serratia fonticola]MBP0997325.1 DUF1240 domain-containing protein [Serratia fonticola]MBP1002924.1 DUF1240 domain-containing protein [Serratia fonticola]MBP1012784.1 DUF1240 domain-containing protein [Serratia fonticola]
MKNKLITNVGETVTVKERLSSLLVAGIFSLGCIFAPSIISNYIISFTYPDVVSFNRLETFILAIIPASAVYFLMFFHLSITGKNYLAKFKPILIYSLRLTAFLLVVAFIFNWHFTTVLDQHGYGTCWKRSLYSETLYIKDAEECKKRGSEVLRKPRPAYQK